jgi:hypothetical protein
MYGTISINPTLCSIGCGELASIFNNSHLASDMHPEGHTRRQRY